MQNYLKAGAAACAVTLAASVGAYAATIGPTTVSSGEFVLQNGQVMPGDDFSFLFDANGTFRVQDFSLTANGNSAGGDIDNLTIQLSQNGIVEQMLDFDPIFTGTAVSNATEIFGNLVFADGDSFSVSVFEMLSNGNSRPVALTLAFSAVAVPLPAAGLLLLTALAGAGMVGRRRRTAALAA